MTRAAADPAAPRPTAYPTLFSPLELGGVRLRNRLAHASILTRFVRAHEPLPEFFHYHRARARGGTGLIVTEPLAMSSANRAPHRLRAWDDAGLDHLRRLADIVEREDTRLLGQVQDPGRARHAVGRNDEAIGPSALPDDLSWTVPRALETGEIERLIDEWACASRRLQRAGFSGVELSAGHGHLFHQFLSPHSNRREDRYGGDVAGRTRFLVELVAAIRAATRHPFIVGIKLPGDDGVPGSIDLAEAARIAAAIAAASAPDYWTFAWGTHARTLYRHLPDAHGPRHPYLAAIRSLRAAAPAVPTGALGYVTDPNECERALTDGTAELAFLGRPLITDPAFGNKAREGREAAIRYCVSCNTCWRTIIEGSRLECDNNPRVGAADEDAWRPVRAPRERRVVVVGGGVAGLESALAAARRGHAVTLFSAGEEVGGKTRLHAALPGGENLSSTYDFLYLAGREAGVRFELGTAAGVPTVTALAPDVVLLATGSTMPAPAWVPPEFVAEGLIPDLRTLAAALLRRGGREPGRIVLVDEDHTEMTYAAAELLTERFEHVTIVTSRERVAADVSLVNRQGIYQRLHDRRVALVTSAAPLDLAGLEDARLDLVDVYNGDRRALDDVVAITFAGARVPRGGLRRALLEAGLLVETVGDCRAPRSLLATTREAHRVGAAL